MLFPSPFSSFAFCNFREIQTTNTEAVNDTLSLFSQSSAQCDVSLRSEVDSIVNYMQMIKTEAVSLDHCSNEERDA